MSSQKAGRDIGATGDRNRMGSGIREMHDGSQGQELGRNRHAANCSDLYCLEGSGQSTSHVIGLIIV